jgi:hypothetical protein
MYFTKEIPHRDSIPWCMRFNDDDVVDVVDDEVR